MPCRQTEVPRPMPRSNHKPERTCLGCMRRDLKAEMIRLAVVHGRVELDLRGECPGRGGYLHRGADCLGRFVRSRVKEFRSLRLRLSLDERNHITELIQAAG